MLPRVTLLTLAFSISLIAVEASAQWQSDGIAISAAASDQEYSQVVADGAGGAIIVWQDYRSGNPVIYAQRVNASGVAQWTADGVALASPTSHQWVPLVTSDGAGGAIIVWQDSRTFTDYDVYVQRVNASGVPQWTADGVALCTEGGDQIFLAIVSDGAGGAIVSWQDYRSGTTYDVYAQRVNASGVPQWTADGVAVSITAFDQYDPVIASDGAGGAIIAWSDYEPPYDVKAQHVNASGVPQWAVNGVAVTNAANTQYRPKIVSDGSGGAIVAWQDYRNGTDSNIFAQRLNAGGVPQWAADGVFIVWEQYDQDQLEIASDGAGGAIVAWMDLRNGVTNVIYAQRVSASGTSQWAFNGVGLSNAAMFSWKTAVVSDAAGGAVVTWRLADSVYAQHLSASGVPQWVANGVVLATNANDQAAPAVAADGAGGAILTWHHYPSTRDIYAQRVEWRYGKWGHPEPAITSVADVPGDQGGKVKVNWTASGHDVLNLQTITHYSVWRATDPIAAANAVAADPSLLVDVGDVTAEFDGPAFRLEVTPTVDYYWELVGTQPAQYFEGYRYSAATSADSTSQGTATHYFQVLSHTANAFTFWPSNAMSGYSTDNLAPAAPLLLTAQRVGSDVQLKWNRAVAPDLRDYSVYRATSSGVTPVPINFLASSDDTVATDASAPASALYYIVTAFDVHENQSAPSNEASVGGTTSVGNTPPITALTVRDNVPNPFTATTTLRVGLPQASEVEIEVFDVAGRNVMRQRTGLLAAGWREIPFDGRSAGGSILTSGVYFYRVSAAGATVTRKMVIAR